jgi:acetyl-CoA acetyltransferase
MRDVAIIGVGAHATGRFRDKALKDLAYPAVWGALEDAGVTAKDINVAYVGNSLGGLLTGQEGIRGQVVLQHSGITGILARSRFGRCRHRARGRRRKDGCR